MGYGALFAAGYDLWFARAERAGLADLRRRVLAESAGRVLEVGAGTGLNLRHYPAAVSELVLADPEPAMARRLRNRVEREACVATRIVRAPAERLPFADGSFDTVVATFLLCTVVDPAGAAREIARVLAPGGAWLFLEHVRAGHPVAAAWQDSIDPLWRRFARGCHCNRATAATLAAAPVVLERIEQGTLRRMPRVVRPIVHGRARRLAV